MSPGAIFAPRLLQAKGTFPASKTYRAVVGVGARYVYETQALCRKRHLVSGWYPTQPLGHSSRGVRGSCKLLGVRQTTSFAKGVSESWITRFSHNPLPLPLCADSSSRSPRISFCAEHNAAVADIWTTDKAPSGDIVC